MATAYEAREHLRNKRWSFAGVQRLGAKSVSANATLTIDDAEMVYFDASGSAFTVLLPASPFEGLCYWLSENAGSANNVSIDGNGKNINGIAAFAMAAAFQQRRIRYNGTEWRITGAVL